MPDISEFDAIDQQLDALSLDELQLVRVKVDMLIAEKLSQAEQDKGKTITRFTLLLTQYVDFFKAFADEEQKSIKLIEDVAFKRLLDSRQPYPPETLKTVMEYADVAKQQINLWEQEDRLLKTLSEQIFNEEKPSLEDDSLERIIELVDEWMSDDSGYDETILPELRAELAQNRLVEK